MDQNFDLNAIVNEFLAKAKGLVKERGVVINSRKDSGLSLQEVSDLIDVPEENLQAFEDGKEVDDESVLKYLAWFFENEAGKNSKIKDDFELAYLLCEVVIYGEKKDWGKFFDFVEALINRIPSK